MEYGNVPGSSKRFSRLVQGTMMLSLAERDQSFRLLDDVFTLGCNTFDTAHVYDGGNCERALGAWLRDRMLREHVVIIGKGAHPDGERQRVTPADIAADLDDSLARLQTDSIDLYLLHRDDPSVPVGEIVEALNEHQRAGRIHSFGGSNWSVERIQAANAYAEARGLVPFAASSPNFSLAEQVKPPWTGCVSIGGPAGKPARAWYVASQMPVFSWSSLAGGFFSGRFTPSNLDQFDSYFDRVCVDTYCYEANFTRLERARMLAEQKGMTVPQIALAYVLNQPLNMFALVGCRTGAEFAENVAAGHLRLSPDEIAWLGLDEALAAGDRLGR